MSFRKENEIDMDQLAAFLKDAVEKVKTQENPDLLNDIKKVYKKNVPFTLRSYVAAYLTKQCGTHFRPRREFYNDRKNRDYRKDNQKVDFKQNKSVEETTSENTESRTPHPRVQIDEALATTIFVGIGRNRRVYPRDLVGLLISVAGLERDRIGDIRVLANYSFVQLFTEDSDKAINALNGYEYRGRKLSVSYSRQKGDDIADGEETIPSNVDSGYIDAADQMAKEDAEAYAAAERAAKNEGFSVPSSSSDSNYLV
ncbi:MAG: DbpA RNA binding domain-containing protein [Treponema sp.]|uniref:DbpA RNA binding domain-containing protein n=1 Tax=Treponema sp. TaxID=166 RepID=UPI001D81AF52|nr:DbpA RNA binding domain-containing protein [Treponema sp.]MBS7311272.1 DbpA RNA binding domain-containing protein [Treponema sp.]MCI5696596.1 DbpA RNA binding domain-containing protein [Spirochaetia bacterium]MDD5811002.1 DbpA RNA binding domain-containing protein [Treponema sp.]MDY5884776.1 DbpA RNA binding domain-containing protein [Treponema sp.]